MLQQEIYTCIENKVQILEEIAANTEIQIWCIRKLQMKGLKRKLSEREALLNDLAAVNKQLDKVDARKSNREITDLLDTARKKQTEVLKAGQQALQAAVFEQNSIKAKLQRIRIGRNIQNGYLKRWMPVYGRINTRG